MLLCATALGHLLPLLHSELEADLEVSIVGRHAVTLKEGAGSVFPVAQRLGGLSLAIPRLWGAQTRTVTRRRCPSRVREQAVNLSGSAPCTE